MHVRQNGKVFIENLKNNAQKSNKCWWLFCVIVSLKITAYGGQLKYAVYYEAREETGPSSYEPQVIIKGGPNHNMVMTRHITGLQIGQLTRHEIDMTEVQ